MAILYVDRGEIVQKKLPFVAVILAVWITACQPAPPTPISAPTDRPDEVHVGPLRRVSQLPYILEPHIAVNPTNPNHLAAVVASVSEFDYSGGGIWELVLYTSTDGGATWDEQIPFETSAASADGVVGFGPDGMLYVVGLTGQGTVLTVRANDEGKMTLSNTSAVTSTYGNDKPWLTIDQHSGTLYVTYDGPAGAQNKEDRVLLAQSNDQGLTWSTPVMASAGVLNSDIESGQASTHFGAQVLLGKGNNLAIVWAWSPGFDTLPSGVWIATSNDKGQTFSEARQIAETWGIISTAFYEGDSYIFYRQGTEQSQQLAAAISHDGGTTWTTSSVSGELPLYFDIDKAPGVNVAPNGTIDVMFYAQGEGAPECINMAAFRKRREQGWVDQCVFNIYYTFSKDGGQTFHAPIKLNDAPVIGSRFVRTRGMSRPGEYMGMASTDDYAYPVWIDTQGAEGTQAYTVRIER
jgi:hypothetical protein